MSTFSHLREAAMKALDNAHAIGAPGARVSILALDLLALLHAYDGFVAQLPRALESGDPCPSCGVKFFDGDCCARGGCPMGGDL